MGEGRDSKQMIDSYRFGRIVVDGVEYTRDLIILPERVEGGWWREEGHRLGLGDLGEALAAEPEVLVVGKGYLGRMRVGEDVERALSERGIAFRAEKTGRACEVYNELVREGKRAVAALHLTC